MDQQQLTADLVERGVVFQHACPIAGLARCAQLREHLMTSDAQPWEEWRRRARDMIVDVENAYREWRGTNNYSPMNWLPISADIMRFLVGAQLYAILASMGDVAVAVDIVYEEPYPPPLGGLRLQIYRSRSGMF